MSLNFNSRAAHHFVSVFKDNETIAFVCVVLLGIVVLAGLVWLLFKMNFLEELHNKLLKKPLFAKILLTAYSMICAMVYIFSGFLCYPPNCSTTFSG